MFPLRPYIRDPPPQLHTIHTIRNRHIQIPKFFIISFRQRILLIPLPDRLLLFTKPNPLKSLTLFLGQGRLASNLREPSPQRATGSMPTRCKEASTSALRKAGRPKAGKRTATPREPAFPSDPLERRTRAPGPRAPGPSACDFSARGTCARPRCFA